MSELYTPVNSLWASIPPCTRAEATKAAKRLRRHFGMPPSSHVRQCWVSLEGGREDRGWHRLVHDISHRHSRREFPSLNPHGPHHARIEREMVEYVLAKGWLSGRLKAPAKAKATTDERRSTRLDRTDASIKRWESKLKRAETALRKLRARRRRLVKKDLTPGVHPETLEA